MFNEPLLYIAFVNYNHFLLLWLWIKYFLHEYGNAISNPETTVTITKNDFWLPKWFLVSNLHSRSQLVLMVLFFDTRANVKHHRNYQAPIKYGRYSSTTKMMKQILFHLKAKTGVMQQRENCNYCQQSSNPAFTIFIVVVILSQILLIDYFKERS